MNAFLPHEKINRSYNDVIPSWPSITKKFYGKHKFGKKCIENKIDVNMIVKAIIYDHAFLEY